MGGERVMSPKSNNSKGNPELLVKAAAAKKKDAVERLEKAIQQVLDSGETITFKAIAETAGLSVSYLYKYPEIKNRIAELRNQQKAAIGGIVNKTPQFQPATDKSKAVIISKLRQENRRLRSENEDLKKHIEVAQGKVIELRQVEAENNRLKQRIKELEESLTNIKVTPINKKKQNDISLDILIQLQVVGVKLNPTLTKTIKSASEETVLDAIEALKDQLTKQNIPNAGGWLNKAISEGWTKSETIPQQSTKPEQKIVKASDKPQKEQVSLTQLKKLSSIFNKDE
jgi:phosphotransferase system HPr-like phosphotransfer protein